MSTRKVSLVMAGLLVAIVLITQSGCKALPGRAVNTQLVIGDPALGVPIDGVTGPVVGAPVVGPPVGSFVDRHPLLRKPVEFYHKTDHGCLVKTLSATFLGVPVGIVCEAAQIVAGCPSTCSQPAGF